MTENSHEAAPWPAVLGLSSIYPNDRQPHAASFNRQQLEALAGYCRFGLVAPVLFRLLFEANPQGDPPRASFDVRRPIYWYVPGALRGMQGWFYFWSAWPALRRMAAGLEPDVMLATWAYPDGWAAVRAARLLGLPLVLKLHGSDILQQAKDPARRGRIRRALIGSRAVVAVSRSLADAAVELGAAADGTFVVPNGVDTALFRPMDKAEARRSLGLPEQGPLVLFAGRLTRVKDPGLALEAVAGVPGAGLVVVGRGDLGQALRRRAEELGLARRVIWAGEQPLERMPRYMAAADCLCLSSRSEGSPNVVREALSCGLPVASTDVGDVADLLGTPVLGGVCPLGDAGAMAAILGRVLANPAPAAFVSAQARIPSWADSARMLRDVLQRVAARGALGVS